MSLVENLNCENKLNFKFDDETVGLFRRYFAFKIMELFLDDTIVFGESLDDKLTYFAVIGPVIKDRLYDHEFCYQYHKPKNGLLEDNHWLDLECFYNMMSFILKKSILIFNYTEGNKTQTKVTLPDGGTFMSYIEYDKNQSSKISQLIGERLRQCRC